MLAICDCEILGKTLREGKIVFHVKEEFYNGGRVSIEEAMDSSCLFLFFQALQLTSKNSSSFCEVLARSFSL